MAYLNNEESDFRIAQWNARPLIITNDDHLISNEIVPIVCAILIYFCCAIDVFISTQYHASIWLK